MGGYIAVIAAAALLAGCVAVCLFIRRYYRSRMEAVYQNLLQKLDCAIGGGLQDNSYDESIDAAVVERLNRVVQIAEMNQGNAEREKELMQSFISDISHQIRTPLANIMLYVGLLQEQNVEQDTRLLIDKIQKQSDKLDFFMKELVQSSYAEQAMIALHPETACVEEIINTACQMVELAALRKRIKIVQEETKAICYADKKWTTEALGNVLDNAVKYSPEDSLVTVRAISYESFVCIQIEDQGIGIREEERGLIFERFYRSEDVRHERGVGIGLYLVREVLSKQGGYVKIKSEVGKGTTVQMFLSRYPCPSGHITAGAEAANDM